MGIDNAYVEIDNLEVPILDGSGLPFVRADRARPASGSTAASAATCASAARSRWRTRASASASCRTRRFRLTCEIDFPHPLVGRQSLEMEVTPERYATEIASARTFGFEYELDQMRNMGLIRGASLENAVCFTTATAC